MKKRFIYSYALYGALFGLAFPLGATLFDLFSRGLPLNFTNILHVQQTNILHFVIDSAPLFLGLFAALAGRKQDRLAYINQNLEIEIAERTRDITDAHEQAQVAIKAKNRFLSAMSHELRTPLNGILGFTQLLQKNNALNSEAKNDLNLIATSAEALLTTISQILSFSQVQGGDIKYRKKEFLFKELIEEISSRMGVKAKEKGLLFEHHVDPHIPECLEGDVEHLAQVIRNLLDNAWKFSHSGKIQLAVSLLGQNNGHVRLQFVVADEGIGIPQAEMDNIFSSFTQVHSSENRLFDGAGLGLTICKKLVEGMGGKLSLSSEVNVGTKVVFELTFKKGEVQNAIKNKFNLLNTKILVAEDNRINQVMVEKILIGWKAEVTIVENGQIAIEAFESDDFDLILMDLHMPKVDGYAAVEAIRKSFKGRKIPIIALSADVFEETRQRILNNGFNDFVAKPFKSDQLYQSIQRQLGYTPLSRQVG